MKLNDGLNKWVERYAYLQGLNINSRLGEGSCLLELIEMRKKVKDMGIVPEAFLKSEVAKRWTRDL